MALAGCDGDGVRHYQAPKLEAPTRPVVSRGDTSQQRMLAAIVPHRDQTWFFKLLGEPAAVAEQKEAFDRFVRSVHFPGDREIDWSVPEGWTEQPGSGMSYATFRINEAPLKLTVTRLGAEAAAILPNINRWRGQIGLAPMGEAELDKETTRVEIDDATATLVDMTGPGGSSGGMGAAPFAARSEPSQPAAAQAGDRRPTIGYTKPAAWKERPGSGSMQLVTFDVEEAGERAQVSVVPLPGAAGGVLENIQRWRGQVDLERVPEDELRRAMQTIDVAGHAAHYVDLVGPASAGASRKRILGVIAERSNESWFFKMIGPAELVGRQKPAFESFVRSVKFE